MTGRPAGPAPEWLAGLARNAAAMAVPPMLRPPPDGSGRPSAVLLLFGETGGHPDLLIVQRSPWLRRHAGQPAFPGGAIEPQDGGPVGAALREAREEAAVEPAGVQPLAVLPELFIARSGFRVTPVLAWWRRPSPVVTGGDGEIASAARVRLTDLADPANRLTVRHPSGYAGPAFRLHGMLVWGFTAALLDRLLALGGWERPWDAGRAEDLPPAMLRAADADTGGAEAAGGAGGGQAWRAGGAGRLANGRAARPTLGAAGEVALYRGLVPGDLLDLILIALAAAFGVAGYRQGFIVGVLSFVGFIGGAAIGAVFSPSLARALVSKPAQQALVAIIAVFLSAMIGQLLASLFGAAMRSRLTWRSAALVDSVGGAGVSVLSVMLIAWFIGSAVANAPFPGMARQVNDSVVLRGVDRFMPSAAESMFSEFRRLLASGPYPQVFGALGPEGALTVARPNPRILNSPAVAKDRGSIVKIVGISRSCNKKLEGSGFVIGPGHVITNAHVVAGVTNGLKVSDFRHRTYTARVVLFDPQRDLAVLYVPRFFARALHFAGHAGRGHNAIVAGFPLNGSFDAVPARVGSESAATAPNIYSAGSVTRNIYSVRAQVKPGNSGGPLLAPNGRVYGVIFAAAVDVRDIGYALTAGEVGPDARAGRFAVRTVSTQPWHCD